VAWNALLLVREVWYRFFNPGTFRALVRAAWATLTTGAPFQWPQLGGAAALAPGGLAAEPALGPADPVRWYVTSADLETFKDAVERGAGPAWQEMLRKEWPGCSYVAFRRTLASGKTEYKSVTVSEDATAQEFMDFYLDDDERPAWDGMITSHSLLEAPPALAPHRAQVVRWLRSFPFAFISRREYVIARRVFQGGDDGALYAITRSVDHPAAPRAEEGLVRMESYYSMWRSRTVPCPRGTARPAAETTLLHFEDFGVPEHLARFAVRHGMAGFVGKMVPRVEAFVLARRARCAPTAADPRAYGAGLRPAMGADTAGDALALALAADAAAAGRPAASRTASDASTCADDSASERSGRVPRSPSMRGLAYMVLASGVAIALSRAGSSSDLAAAQQQQQQQAAAAAAPAASPRGRYRKHVHAALNGARQRANQAVQAKLHGLRSHRVHGGGGGGGGGEPAVHRRRHRPPTPAIAAAALAAGNSLE
jgi:hypothetical protein